MSFFKKYPLSFLFYWFILTGLLFCFSFLFCTNIFPRVYVLLKFYRPENFFQLVLLPDFCHPVRFVSANSRYDLSDSSCYPARIEMQLLLSPNSSNQQLFEKKFDYLKRFTTTRDGPPTALQFYDIHIYVKFTSTKFSDFQIPLVYSHGYSWISRIKIILLNKMQLQGGANFS